ncbi:MAG: DUF1152 domain-containing protein [Desulfurococcaceae archaeon]
MDCLLRPGYKVFVLAIGGGGDIASAALIAKALSRIGVKYVLGSIAWERYVYDESPGPIRLSEILNAVQRRNNYVLIDENSYALRRSKVVVFQAAKAAKALGEQIYVIDVYGGVKGYVQALRSIIEEEKVDLVIGVDVGGDSIAKGCEHNLWSPLADWIGLASLALVNGVIAVHSPGSDGELDQEYVLDRINYFAVKGALRGVRAMCSVDAEFLSKILEYVDSEASWIPLLACKGVRGEVSIRNGTRSVKVSLINTLTFFLDARAIADDIEPVRALYDTTSLEEARSIINDHGIYTELDLEEDIDRQGLKASELTREILIDIRSKGIVRIRSKASRNYCVQDVPGNRETVNNDCKESRSTDQIL